MAYDGYGLSTPSIGWLGLRPTDLELYHLDTEEMIKKDLAAAKNLLSEPFVQTNADWVAELHRMLRKKDKAGLHALDELQLVNYYFPLKLQVLNWIENIQHNCKSAVQFIIMLTFQVLIFIVMLSSKVSACWGSSKITSSVGNLWETKTNLSYPITMFLKLENTFANICVCVCVCVIFFLV